MKIGYYGKLPHFEDFIGSINDDPLNSAIRDWLNHSSDSLFHALGTTAKQDFPDLGNTAMLVRPDAATSPIVCLWSPSRDRSGRQAPFSIYAMLEEDLFSDSFNIIPEAYRSFLQKAAINMESDSGINFEPTREQETLSDLDKTLQFDKNELSVSCTSFIQETSIEHFTTSLDNSFGDGFGLRCLFNVIVALAPSRNNINDGFRSVFRFPLSAVTDKGGQEIAFWIKITEMLLDIKLQQQSVFWSSSQLHIVFGPCDENILANVLTISADDDNLWDFGGMNLDGTMMDKSLFEQYEKVLHNNSSRLVDIQRVTTSQLATG